MAVTDSDIIVYSTYGTKFNSIGGIATTSRIVWASDRFKMTERDENVHNLFQIMRPGEIDNTRSVYRCIAIKNNSAETWYAVKGWIVDADAMQTEVSIELAPAQADPPEQLGSEFETPSNAVFVNTAISRGTGVTLGDIAAGGYAYLWIKRTPTASAKSRSFETIVIRVEGESTQSATTYVGRSMIISWHTLTSEIQVCLRRLNDIPEGRINLEGAQEFYDDSMYIVDRLASSTVSDEIKARVAQSRAIYLIYQEYTVELERAGAGLPPMVVSRVYELRRIANEMFNTITGSSKKMDVHAIKGRSFRGRIY